MQRYEDVVLRDTGTFTDPVGGASITVYDAGTTDLVTIYSDDGVTPAANPTTADANGQFFFYAHDGIYDLLISHASITSYTKEDVMLVDPSKVDTDDFTYNVATLLTSTRLKAPTAAPGTPAAGDVWEASDTLVHGANSKVAADLATEQSFTKSQTITATATAGKVGLTVKGNATAAADVLDIYDSAGTPAKQSWFASTGEFGTNLNLLFKSGTAFTGTLDHAITADRTWTLPDVAGTVAMTTAPGTTGTDVAWSATGQLLVPDASASNRGVITTGTQTIAGAKTFTGNMALGSANTFTIGDVELARASANVLQLGTADSFQPQTDSQSLGSTTKQWSLFTDEITVGADVVLNRAAANALQLATGDKFIPQTSGQSLGDSSNPWAIEATTIAASGAVTLSSTLSYRNLTETVAAANTITAAESGSVFFLNDATEFDSTLPAPAAGLRFTFVVTGAPSGGSYTISTNGSANIIKGQVYSSDLDAAGNADIETTGADTISFVDSIAVAGDRVELYCDGTNWFAYGYCSVFNAITFTTVS